jgi:hypothetical protein
MVEPEASAVKAVIANIALRMIVSFAFGGGNARDLVSVAMPSKNVHFHRRSCDGDIEKAQRSLVRPQLTRHYP